MRGIHQITAGYANGDAISNEARVLRAMFRSWGAPSDIFCETRRTLPELRRDARDLAELRSAVQPGDTVILHLSIGSPANEAFAQLACRKVILYHNITPPDFFRGIQPEIESHLKRGLEQIRALRNAADINLAVSAFNARELEAMGYRDVRVMPMRLDRAQWEGPADPSVLRRFRDGRTNVLFVGRGAPNKRIEDLLLAHFFVQNYVDPDARLIHAGSFAGLERYHALLLARLAELQLRNVVFAGSIPAAALRAYYQSATVFLCLSEHEGFCIPLIEAMAHGIPVVAYAAAAVPETMDGAGILLREKRYEVLAELIGRIARDSRLRQAIVEGQNQRLARYLGQDFEGRWRSILAA